ncbi:uncharacterized protein LOC144093928 isoform X2 [Amblyomma americanum]
MPTKGAHLWDAKEEKHECDDVKCEQGLISRSPGNCSGASQQLLCSICKKTFSRKYHLARHLQNAVCSGEQRLSLPCSTCGKVFSSKTKLDHHIKTHSVASDSNQKSSLKRFECNHCGRLFWSLSQLEIHKRMHTGERPFKCAECSKAFVSLGALNKHKLCHSEEKPFTCPHCPARFSLKGTLNRHIPTHTGVRTHKCPHCSKDFIQAVALRAHLVTHTGVDGFPCHICGHVFSRKARMKEHVRCVHEGQRHFECATCGKKFSRKDDLLTHQELRHGLVRKLLGGLNPAWSSLALITAGSDNSCSPRAFAQDVCLEGSVISHCPASEMSPGRDDAPADMSIEERECKIITDGKHVRSNTFHQTQNTESHPVVKESCVMPSSKKKLCTENSCADVHTAENHTFKKKQSLGSDVSCHSLHGGSICLKTEELQVEPEEDCDDLKSRVQEFLCFLIEKPILKQLGWPNADLCDLLEAVIRHCGCSPSQSHCDSLADRLRENCKVLFTQVLEDDVAGKLLDSDETVDAVLEKVLQLARLG